MSVVTQLIELFMRHVVCVRVSLGRLGWLADKQYPNAGSDVVPHIEGQLDLD